jgi:hypothetical protein
MIESKQVSAWQNEVRRTDLRDLLQERFGTVTEAVRQRIEATTDPERLRAALRQVLHINAPDELQL